MKNPTVPGSLTDALALAILTELPRFGTNNAVTILDVIAAWTGRGYAGKRIQDALEQLWDLQLICTDDDETPPISPLQRLVLEPGRRRVRRPQNPADFHDSGTAH